MLEPERNSIWKHRNGNLYQVICITNVETSRPEKYPTTVVYFNINNFQFYSRPLELWTENSFTKVVDAVEFLKEDG